MINLTLINKNFQGNEKWPLLYVVAEIFINDSSYTHPLTNIEATNICKEKYGLTIERRTISFYKTILETHFGFRFQRKGKGYYLLDRHFECNDKECFEGIEFFNSNPFKRVIKNIKICKRAIFNKKYVNFVCKDYINKNLEIKNKILKLIPIRILCFDNRYFMFAYCIAINDYFYVNLALSDIEVGTTQTIDQNQKNKMLQYKNYFKQADIVTGRIGIIDSLYFELSESGCIELTENSQFPQELINSLHEKYGEENVSYYKKDNKITIEVYSIEY